MSAVKRGNGGVVGVENTTTTSAASGIWGLNEVLEARKNDLWPTMGLYNYPVEQSLRFNGSSYLESSNTSSAGSLTTWTWSVWVKRSELGANQTIFEAIWPSTSYDKISFLSNDTILGVAYVGGYQKEFVSTEVFRDTSAWYHIVWVWDTTNTDANSRHVIYVNNRLLTKSSGTAPAASAASDSMNKFDIRTHVIGYHGYSSSEYSNLYLANIHFIDGQALSPYFFGELIGGVWTPKTFDGTASDGNTGSATNSYGTNGFHLTFAPNTVDTVSSPNRFLDQSPNSNHWDIY